MFPLILTGSSSVAYFYAIYEIHMTRVVMSRANFISRGRGPDKASYDVIDKTMDL